MKTKHADRYNFGERLARIRKQRGLSQEQLAKSLGVSRRVIAYFEVESHNPPAKLLHSLVKVLNVSIDELLGFTPIKQQLDPEKAALWRKLKKAEILSRKDRKTLLDLLNALIIKSKVKNA